MDAQQDYRDWSHERLVERVTQLEQALKKKTLNCAQPEQKGPKKTRPERQFDPFQYNTRLIALKLAYLGKCYNGFEHHANNKTPLPTIEEELWKALNKARLISPQGTDSTHPGEFNWEGCDYSKCGRTDKGVSAFGQVISIRVRSNKPMAKPKVKAAINTNDDIVPKDFQTTFPREDGNQVATTSLESSTDDGQGEESLSHLNIDSDDESSFDPIRDEIPYAQVLNRLLPPDIRILAWCPNPPPDFSARFKCKERQYRYFFTQPAFVPTPSNLEDSPPMHTAHAMKDGWLNIEAMREAAQSFVGVHDFRNFCKVDPSKQISNFEREMFYADIVEVGDTTSALDFVNSEEFLPADGMNRHNPSTASHPKVYTFTLHGSAFLWHQVRHMVAVLFLVGQGLEPASIVSDLLDVQKNPRRPMYEMASDTPLVLWDCIFPHPDDSDRRNALEWLYIGDGEGAGEAKWGSPGLMENLWKVWRERKIDEVLAGNLLEVVAKQGRSASDLCVGSFRKAGKSQKVFDGSDKSLLRGSYIPVMKKPRLESVETINDKYAVRKGFENSDEMRELGFRRLSKPNDKDTA